MDSVRETHHGSNFGNPNLINISNNGATAFASSSSSSSTSSRYENQKRRDWNTFCQYLKNHMPPLSLSRCSGVTSSNSFATSTNSARPKSTLKSALSMDSRTHLPFALALSIKRRAALTLSSAASELPLKKMEENPKPTHLGYEL